MGLKTMTTVLTESGLFEMLVTEKVESYRAEGKNKLTSAIDEARRELYGMASCTYETDAVENVLKRLYPDAV